MVPAGFNAKEPILEGRPVGAKGRHVPNAPVEEFMLQREMDGGVLVLFAT